MMQALLFIQVLIQRTWRWWLAEFLGLLPLAYLNRLARPRFTLLLRRGEEVTQLAVMVRDQCLQQQEVSHAVTSEEEVSQLKDAIHAATNGKGVAVIGVIPEEQSLVKPIGLPFAAKAHIEEAVRYQIERLSPFKSDNTLYGVKLLESEARANELRLQLIIISKALVQDLETRGARLGLPIDRFAIERAGCGALEPLAFTSEAPVATKLPLAAKALLATSLILIVSLLLVPVLGKWKRQEALGREVGLLKPKADQVLKLAGERDKIIALRGQVIGLKRAGTPPVAILSKLSELLDDHSFLFEVRMEGAIVTMSGFSTDASKLAQRLGAISVFKSVKFSGPVLRDQQAARDRFTLVLELAASS
jgi:general secretion pathway protein L